MHSLTDAGMAQPLGFTVPARAACTSFPVVSVSDSDDREEDDTDLGIRKSGSPSSGFVGTFPMVGTDIRVGVQVMLQCVGCKLCAFL